MKHTYSTPPQIVRNMGDVIGVSLGAGGCAEHDAKLEGFQHILGIGRTQNSPEAQQMLEENDFDPESKIIGVEKNLITNSHMADIREFKAHKKDPAELRLFIGPACTQNLHRDPVAVSYRVAERPLTSAWSALFSSGSLEMRAFTDEARDAVRNVYAAMQSGEALIAGYDYRVLGLKVLGIGDSSPVLVDRRGLTAEQRQEIIAQDISDLQVQRTVDATGIPEALEKAGIKFHAFRADVKANGELEFFINPAGNKYNFGRFSGDDLLAMIDGNGPAMKDNRLPGDRPFGV